MALNFPSNPNTNDTYSYNNRTWVFTGSAWKQLRSDASDITTTGNITANVVTANSFIGDGSQLTGLPAGYTDSNVASYLPTYTGNITAGNISVTGTIDGYATTSYVDSEVANLVASAPSTLDTLNELASALGNDPNLSTTLTSLIGNNSANITTLQGNITTLESDIANLEANIPANLQSNVTTLEGNIVSIESDVSTLQGNITSIESDIANLEANIPANLQSNVTTLESNVITLQGNIVTLDNQVANLNYYDDTNVTTFLSDIGSNSIATTGNITADYFIGNGSQLIGLPAAYTDSNVESLLSGNITIGNISVTGAIDGYATTSYVDSEVANLVASAPSTLDTLNELATALGNDPNLSTTLTSLIGNNSANITTLQGNITSIETDIFNLEANIPANLQSNVTTLESNVTILQGNIVALESNITILDNQVANLNYYDDTNVTTFLSDIGSNAITTTGDITANSFIGDGSQLTGLPESYTDSNVATFLSNIGNNSILTTGNITAGYFIGDGSELTGLNASANLTLSNTAPTSPTHGDLWVDSTNGKKLYYIDDGDSQQWVELDLTTSISIGSQESANIDLSAVDQNIVPSANITYDLGSETNRWRDIYLANSTIYLGEANISAQGGALTLPSTVSIGNSVLDSSSGNLALPSTVSIGSVTLDASTGNLALPANSSIGGASVSTPRIASIDYGDDDTAANIAGGQTIGIVGSGFSAGAQVLLDGSSIGVVTVVNSGRIEITAPAKSTGSYTLYVINSDGATGIYIPGVQYSGVPSWSSPSAGSLGSIYETETVNNTFVANSDSTVSYSLYSGNLPEGTTLDSNTGVLTGNANLIVGSSVTYNFTIRATDEENQDTDRAFSLTVNADEVTWSSPTDGATVSLIVDQSSTTTLVASSAAGDNISYSANTLPNGLSVSGATITGTPTTIANTSVELTATANTTTRSATITVTFAVTLLLGDEYFKQTSLVLTGDDNTFITDASDNNILISPIADVRPSAFSPYNTSWSNYFDGTADSLNLSSNAALTPANGDFCIECWIYPTAAFDTYNGIFVGNALNGFFFGKITDGIGLRISGVSDIISATAPNINQWTHIAITRSGTDVRLFYNGVQQGSTVTNSTNFAQSTTYIGDNGASSAVWEGYISNLRFVKGTAVYTSNFTPSTAPLTAISGTSLLTCQSNRLIDNSTNAFAITRVGNIKATNFGPFTETNTTHGSAYFDGTDDYLAVLAADASPLWLGTGDFTIEGWFYREENTATSNQLWQFENGASLLWYSNNVLYYQVSPGNSTVYVNPSWIPTGGLNDGWHHYAMTRESGTIRVYIDGRFLMSSTTSANTTSGYFYIGNGSYTVWQGWISDFRIVKGTALYTGGSTSGEVIFVPPTEPLTAVSGTALLTCQNSIGYNNSQPIDESGIKNVITRNGNASVGSYSPYVPSGWSGYFDGTGDFLSIPDDPNLEIGSGSFTLECWVNLDSLPANNQYRAIMGKWANGLYSYLFQIGRTSDTLKLFFSWTVNASTGKGTSSDAISLSLGVWYHIAFSKSGSTLRFFLDGNLVGTSTVTDTIINTNALLNIGRHGDNMNYFTGYISNLRFLVGTALYTEDFDDNLPTEPLTAISGTTLLTLRGTAFTDDGPNRFAITRNGDTKITPFSPFAPHTVTPDSHSVYFDGTGDYLQIANNDALKFRTGDFTVEGWFYGISSTAVTPLFNIGAYTAGILMRINSNPSGDPLYINGTMYNWNPVTNFLLNQWNHVALTRSSGTIYVFINGVQVFTASNSADINQTADTYIGVQSHQLTTAPFQGHVSNFRIVKGTALYTANFTPLTSPLTAISGTSLLTCQSPTVIDNSTNNFAITVNGNSQPTKFNPFGETVTTNVEYSPTSHGGSVYFPGAATDGLIAPQTADFNLSQENWTIEAWYYALVGPSSHRYITALASNNSEIGVIVQTNFILNYFGSSSPISTSVPPALHSWQHVALVKNGIVTTLYIDGVARGSASNVNWFNGSTRIYFGSNTGSPSFQFYYNGYISGARVVRESLYTSNFVVPTAPPSPTPSTVLFYNFAKSAAIQDKTGRNVLETVGNARTLPESPYRLNKSVYFDGTGDYLTFPNNTAFAFGTGAFTIEFWINAPINNDKFILGGRSAIGTMGITTGGYAGSLVGALRYFGSSTIVSSNVITDSSWHHCAIVRDGSNNITLYVDGVSVGTGTDTTNYTTTSGSWNIGKNDLASSNYLTGYLSGLRIVKGTAVYTSTFTPPTSPLTAISGTSLLTCQSYNFKDNSTNDFTITRNGDAKVTSRGPFTETQTSDNAMYFDGTGDVLFVRPTGTDLFAFGSGDFTIEFWLYFSSVAGVQVIYDQRPTSTNGAYPTIYWDGSSIKYYANNADRINGGSLSVSTWYHLAISRSGTSTKMFIDGTQVGSTYTDSTTYLNPAGRPAIGFEAFSGVQYYFNGYIDDLRATKGVARYTANFTPPTSTYNLK